MSYLQTRMKLLMSYLLMRYFLNIRMVLSDQIQSIDSSQDYLPQDNNYWLHQRDIMNSVILSLMFIICLVYLLSLCSSSSFTIVRSSIVLLSTIHYFVIIVNHVLLHKPHYDITILTCSLSQLHIIVSSPFINKYRCNIYVDNNAHIIQSLWRTNELDL